MPTIGYCGQMFFGVTFNSNCKYRVKKVTFEISESLHDALRGLVFVEVRSLPSTTKESLEMLCVDRLIEEIKTLHARKSFADSGVTD